MPKVFVHGNPETSVIWSELIDQLHSQGVKDIVTLSPPGFGAPVPEDFNATRSDYCHWLIEQLEQIEGDIDLVGHDIGALHVYGMLAERPELVRSWATDCAGTLHPDYVWHDAAQGWQTPGVGEKVIGKLYGLPQEQHVTVFQGMGLPGDTAAELGPAVDKTMGQCVLRFYRSAPQPELINLGKQLKNTSLPPGLVVIASKDTYAGTIEMSKSVAADLNANTLLLSGYHHWWMLSKLAAEQVAASLIEHWRTAV